MANLRTQQQQCCVWVGGAVEVRRRLVLRLRCEADWTDSGQLCGSTLVARGGDWGNTINKNKMQFGRNRSDCINKDDQLVAISGVSGHFWAALFRTAVLHGRCHSKNQIKPKWILIISSSCDTLFFFFFF